MAFILVQVFFFLFSLLTINLIQQGSHKGHHVRRREAERVWCVPVLNVLSSGESHTHSVCRRAVGGTLQPKPKPFQTRLAGRGLRGLAGKLAAQGIQGTLNPVLAHSHAFIPLFTLDH